jgi:hypothetical protein
MGGGGGLKGSNGKDEARVGEGRKTQSGPGKPGGEVVEGLHRQEARICLKKREISSHNLILKI